MIMDFYESIVEYYDDIFPLNHDQVDFVKTCVTNDNKEANILDIGCGTGSVSIALADLNYNVIGIDFDDGMIKKAWNKGKGRGNLNFFKIDMTLLRNKISNYFFDAIICFGNTLPHLKSLDEISSFINGIKNLLRPGKKILIQLLNYDMILKNQVTQLPLIENGKIKFERYYKFHNDTQLIDFQTILTIKKENRKIDNNIQLYPLTQKQITHFLNNASFHKVLYYSNFKKDKFEADSLSLVIEAML